MAQHNSNKTDVFYSLKNQFLIAMPSLEDSIFSHTVTYVCDHNEQGAMGVIINQPLGITLGDVFDQLMLETAPEIRETQVLAGGPVNAQQGLVLHRSGDTDWQSTMHITSEISLTASKDIIEAMAEKRGPKNAQLTLGYAGWEGGQLEDEISNNCWLTAPANAQIIFDVPTEHRWNAVAKNLGVDLNLISPVVGHA